MSLAFRPATPADLERLLEIHVAVFPDPRGMEERRRNFTLNPLGALEDLHVAVEGDALVAHAFLFRLEGFFGRRRVPLAGVASVGVAPEARGRGVGSALLAHLHREADICGDALTMLYAFRQGYYTRLGYAPTTSRKRLSIDPRSIPWRAGRVRRPNGEDRAAIVRAYERAALETSGWLVRPQALWDRRFLNERRQLLVLEGDGRELAGYVAFELVQSEPHAVVHLDVDEIVATSDDARRALWGALGAMRDQVGVIDVEVDLHDPIELALVDADRWRHGTEHVEHTLGSVVGGPMVRIEDATRAIEARGYAADGTFDLVLDDEVALTVHVEGGRATVTAAQGRRPQAIATTRRGLACLLYGGARLSDAARIGLVAADPRVVAEVEAVLALPPVLPLDAF